MAANLDKLIAKPPPSKNLTFRISAGISKEDTPDEKALLGEKLKMMEDNMLLMISPPPRFCPAEYS